jgi:hypothetical protein
MLDQSQWQHGTLPLLCVVFSPRRAKKEQQKEDKVAL